MMAKPVMFVIVIKFIFTSFKISSQNINSHQLVRYRWEFFVFLRRVQPRFSDGDALRCCWCEEEELYYKTWNLKACMTRHCEHWSIWKREPHARFDYFRLRQHLSFDLFFVVGRPSRDDHNLSDLFFTLREKLKEKQWNKNKDWRLKTLNMYLSPNRLMLQTAPPPEDNNILKYLRCLVS